MSEEPVICIKCGREGCECDPETCACTPQEKPDSDRPEAA